MQETSRLKGSDWLILSHFTAGLIHNDDHDFVDLDYDFDALVDLDDDFVDLDHDFVDLDFDALVVLDNYRTGLEGQEELPLEALDLSLGAGKVAWLLDQLLLLDVGVDHQDHRRRDHDFVHHHGYDELNLQRSD